MNIHLRNKNYVPTTVMNTTWNIHGDNGLRGIGANKPEQWEPLGNMM